MTDFSITPAPYDPGTPDYFPETLAMQGPVNGKWYTQYGAVRQPVSGAVGYQKGGVTRVRFSDPCEITEIGLYLNAAHGGTAHNYRLGIYAHSMGEPGALEVDAGTLTINNASTVGMRSIVLPTPYEVGAGQVVWLVCRCDYSSGYPTIFQHNSADLMPYTNYGKNANGTYLVNALAFTSIGNGANALPDPFVLGSPNQVHGLTPAVFVKVSV